MAKAKTASLPALTLSDLKKQLRTKKLNPVYFIFGEDSYGIEKAGKGIHDIIAPDLVSDFDNEVIAASEASFQDVLSAALAFPFSGERKLLTVRNAEELSYDRKPFVQYIQKPAESTVLVFLHQGVPARKDSEEHFKLLAEKGYLYEAKELNEQVIRDWVIAFTEEQGKRISENNAALLCNLVGEDRMLLEKQLEKLFLYSADGNEITESMITEQVVSTKEYTVFQLQDMIAKQNKPEAYRILTALLYQGIAPLNILGVLAKYFMNLLKIDEIMKSKTDNFTAAKMLGVPAFVVDQYRQARRVYSEAMIASAVRALLDADVALKTSTGEPEHIFLTLFHSMMEKK